MKQLSKEEEALLKKLGARIRDLRIQKGFTNYEHFAYENNISRTQYGKYEVGENMKILTLVRILKSLDMSLTEFFSEGFDD
jgi:transcriptional regulator with XRE-family HTH domain